MYLKKISIYLTFLSISIDFSCYIYILFFFYIFLNSFKLSSFYHCYKDLYFTGTLLCIHFSYFKLTWTKISVISKSYISNKKNFMAPFYGWGSTASRLVPLRGVTLLFTTNFPDIPGTHFIDLWSMNGWVNLGVKPKKTQKNILVLFPTINIGIKLTKFW